MDYVQDGGCQERRRTPTYLVMFKYVKPKVIKNRTTEDRYELHTWFVENDYQCCLMNINTRKKPMYRVSLLRNGITTEGKPYKIVGGVRIDSHYFEVETKFKNFAEAEECMFQLWEHVKKDYA
jgi:hypothetical protein